MPPPDIEDEVGYTAVKGEYDISADGNIIMEPLVNHLLAQMHAPQHIASPEHFDDSMAMNAMNTPYPTANSQQVADQSTPRATPRSRPRPALTMEERLQQMPELRALPWRAGVEAGAENETGGESRRKQIRFGCLLVTRGEEQINPCASCANGRGKFSICVALEGFFKGACASCQLSGRPNRCSIKHNDDAPGSSPVNTPVHHTQVEHLQPTSDGPRPKRRRKNPVPDKVPEKVPDWESQRPQWEQELGDSHARQQMKDIVQRPWATVNTQLPISTQPMMMNGSSGVGTLPPNTAGPSALGWSAINQTSPSASASGGQIFGNGGSLNGAGYHGNQEQGTREETVVNEEGSGALIDTLPKQKQRQVYGLVSGLQGGIEHLQRELDSLKRALGIDG